MAYLQRYLAHPFTRVLNIGSHMTVVYLGG